MVEACAGVVERVDGRRGLEMQIAVEMDTFENVSEERGNVVYIEIRGCFICNIARCIPVSGDSRIFFGGDKQILGEARLVESEQRVRRL